MLNNMKIGVRLSLGFALVVSLLLGTLVYCIVRMGSLNGNLQIVTDDRFPKVVMATDMLNAVNVVARAMRNLLLISDEESKKKEFARVEEARDLIADRLKKLDESTKSEKGRELLASVVESRNKYLGAQGHFLKLAEANQREEAVLYLTKEVRQLQSNYLDNIGKLVKFQAESVADAGDEADENYRHSSQMAIFLGSIAVLLSVAIAYLVTRSITNPVNQAVKAANELAEGNLTVSIDSSGSDETGRLLQAMQSMVVKLSQTIAEVRAASDNLTSASEQVSATAQSLSQGATEQASSVEEMSATVEQAAASIQQNAENAKVTDGMAAKAAQDAGDGGDAVNQTVQAMKSIAGKIGIIDDIAYQTNLLALNAAIEAARAGEHGKGFAVVAAEVRKLAERSQEAAQEIGELATSSVDKAEQAGALLKEMVPAIRRTSELVQEIAAASAEQNSGIAQINSAVGQMSTTAQQSASASEELAATAEEMSGQAEQLQQLMAFFKLSTPSGQNSVARRQAKPAKIEPHPVSLKPVKATVAPVPTAEFVRF